jgi:hypothetical protein
VSHARRICVGPAQSISHRQCRANRISFPGSPLANHSSLPSKKVSAEVRARPTALFALNIEIKAQWVGVALEDESAVARRTVFRSSCGRQFILRREDQSEF